MQVSLTDQSKNFLTFSSLQVANLQAEVRDLQSDKW